MSRPTQWLAWCFGFFDAHAPQSMTRLLALLCILAGCVVALKYPSQWQTVTALIGGGGVALMTRSRNGNGGAGDKSGPSSP